MTVVLVRANTVVDYVMTGQATFMRSTHLGLFLILLGTGLSALSEHFIFSRVNVESMINYVKMSPPID